MNTQKALLSKNGEKYFVKDASKDYHCEHGFFTSADLGKKAGSMVKTNLGKEFSVINAGFTDRFERIKRNAQIVSLKEIGLIVAETGLDKDSVVVDAGAGSGALCCFLAHLCKEVITYDVRDDFIEIVKKNKESLGLKNLTIKKGDVYETIDESGADVVTLDVPEPWKALRPAAGALKAGGFIVSYSVTAPQMADFVNALHADEHFVHVKTIELIQREWEADGRKVRPKTTQVVHTGFLSFGRKV